MKQSTYRLALWGFLAVAAFFLWTEHRAHLFAFLPYALFLACPLMHLFMHHGHGHGGGNEEPRHQHKARQQDEQGDA